MNFNMFSSSLGLWESMLTENYVQIWRFKNAWVCVVAVVELLSCLKMHRVPIKLILSLC